MKERLKEVAEILREGLPYLAEFKKSIFVVKYGGAALDIAEMKEVITKDIVLLSYFSIKPVIVHGGAKEIDRLEEERGIKSKKKDGIRITEDISCVTDALSNINKELVRIIQRNNGNAQGIRDPDEGLIKPRAYGEGYGQNTGRVDTINPQIIDYVIDKGYIPVISTYATDPKTGICYNINADEVAGHLAASLKAKKIIMLTNTPGILGEEGNEKTLLETIKTSEIEKLKNRGIISKGMMPKIDACVRALEGGVEKAHIIDGREGGSLILEVLSEEGSGTQIVRDG